MTDLMLPGRAVSLETKETDPGALEVASSGVDGICRSDLAEKQGIPFLQVEDHATVDEQIYSILPIRRETNPYEYDRAWGQIFEEFGSYDCYNDGEQWSCIESTNGYHLFKHRDLLGSDEPVSRQIPATEGWRTMPWEERERTWQESFSHAWQADYVKELRSMADTVESVAPIAWRVFDQVADDDRVPAVTQALLLNASKAVAKASEELRLAIAGIAFLTREYPSSVLDIKHIKRYADGATYPYLHSAIKAASDYGVRKDRRRRNQRLRTTKKP